MYVIMNTARNSGQLLLFFSLSSGEIGGQVGLCVGASLLTVLDFFDVILAMIGIRLGFG